MTARAVTIVPGAIAAAKAGRWLAEVFVGRLAEACRSSLGTSIACAVDHCAGVH